MIALGRTSPGVSLGGGGKYYLLVAPYRGPEERVVKSRYEQIRFVLLLTLLANAAVAISKLGFGVAIRSLSLIADGFHSLLDCTSNIVGLVGIALSKKPPDEKHPYGHRKFETLAAMGISFLLAFAAIEIVENAVRRLLSPQLIGWSPVTIGILLLTIGVNLAVSIYERRKGEQLRSEILIADSYHTRSDFYGALLVLLALVTAPAGLSWADPVAALLIVILITRAAYQIVKDAVASLADSARVDVEALRACVDAIAGVEQSHRVRTRGVAGEVFLDMHVRVDPEMPADELHRLEHEIGAIIHRQFSEVRDVMIHFEPRRS